MRQLKAKPDTRLTDREKQSYSDRGLLKASVAQPERAEEYPMSFGDWPNETIKEIQRGLLLIGWRADMRLTDGDASLIQKVALEAIQLHKENQLTPGQIDRLAVAAHDIMEFQVMNVDERTTMASGPYSESKYFVDLVRLIDEATLCYWRGYDTAALATLFIVLESYLLLLYGWTNVTPRPSFAALKASV
jgi:hypothetical protein